MSVCMLQAIFVFPLCKLANGCESFALYSTLFLIIKNKTNILYGKSWLGKRSVTEWCE